MDGMGISFGSDTYIYKEGKESFIFLVKFDLFI